MTEIVLAEAADADELGKVIAAAFCDLPPSFWLISARTIRQEVFPGYFRIYVDLALAHGIVHTTADRTAVALWMPVGATADAPPDDYDERLTAATTPWTSRFVLFDAALDQHHPAGIPHHHLAILGVRPDMQGKGIGTEMLAHHHAALDQEVVPAYLEAADLRNRDLYLRHGYVDHGPPIQLPDGPRMYPMWRQPAAGGSPG